MNSLHDLVSRLESLRVALWDDDGYLAYSAPEGVLTESLLDAIRARKDELLALLRRGGGATSNGQLHAAPHSGKLPVSAAQRRLWFVCQLEGASVAYNMPFVTALAGALDEAALRRALEAMVQRHESLRTTFRLEAEGPVQVIHPAMPLDMEARDLRELAEPESDRRAAEIEQGIDQAAHQPFDIEHGPLLRVRLLRTADARYVLCIVVHHIVADGWSIGVFVRELAALYGSFTAGRPSALPALAIQYADFTRFQDAQLSGRLAHERLDYWKRKLANVPPLGLPTDRPRPAVESFRGDHHVVRLDRGVLDALQDLGRREGVTLYVVLLAAFNVLLARYAGQDDVVVASGTANRKRAELEGQIGFFVNTVVVRTDLSGDPTFRALLQRVHGAVMEAMEHEDLPFERIVEELRPERTASHNPLAQVALTLQSFASTRLELPGLSSSPVDFRFRTAKLDLMLLVTELAEGLEIVVEYNTDLFEPETIARMAGHLGTLLAAVPQRLEECIGHLPLLAPEERRRILVEWNDTRQEAPEEGFHLAFEAHAAKRPEAIAVVFDGETPSTVTYGELDARANRLAHALLAQGVRADAVVGIHLDRSIEMLVAMLAVLKAGGAYVPLDPAYPPQRIAYMLHDAAARVLVTQRPWSDALPEHAARVLDLAAPQLSTFPATKPSVAVTGDHLAYVIYTSGTTGTPKGVWIPRKDTWSAAKAIAEIYAITPESRVLQFASMNFDGSVVEISMALWGGACLYMAPQEKLLPGAPLHAFLRRHAITHAQLAPSLLARLPSEGLEHLTTLMVAGEASSVGTIEEWLPGRRILNGYGPTETTIGATMGVFTSEDRPYLARQDALPIGRPFANKRVYVLDGRLEPVPIGVSGEVYVATPGLARGYVGRPELTARAFLPNPFSEQPGERLYRTGDLARWLPEGHLVFLGRVDHQIKIRGVRIELEEIESALKAHPYVGDATVAVHEQPDRHIVAYVVPRASWEPSWGQNDHIASWQTLSEQESDDAKEPEDWTFDITGWKSSYTGEPIAAEEMRTWVNATVARILAHEPQDVLEIGVGTGLLLARVAPRVRSYCATDFSRKAIRHLEACKARSEELAHVTLLHRLADDFEGLHADAFDMVVLNSVVQYFPSVDYLLGVLRGAMRVLRPGGTIFLGDVRSLPLLDAYHASVQLVRAHDAGARENLRYRVQQGVMLENELAIDPRFFAALAAQFPEIHRVEVTPKRGDDGNEMTLFRYDVSFRVGRVSCVRCVRTEETHAPSWYDWDEEGLAPRTFPAWLSARLRERARVGVRGIPNARLERASRTLEWLAAGAGGTVGAFRAELDAREMRGVSPESLWALGDELACGVHVGWAADRCDGSLELVVLRDGTDADAIPDVDHPAEVPLSAYVNRPLRGKVLREAFGRDLRRDLQDKLPHAMMPAAFVPLAAMPLTAHGKVDRKALPTPDIERRSRAAQYAAPRHERERVLADIWGKVLGVERVGIEDNFFDLGGDSILSIQIVGQAKQAGIVLTARQMLEHQTIAALAEVVPAGARVQAEQGLVEGDVPLTPIQRWFFDGRSPVPSHFNQALLLNVDANLAPALLAAALGVVFEHHDALRLRFTRAGDGYRQTNLGRTDAPIVDVVDLAHLPVAERAKALTARAALLQASLDITDGPLARVELFKMGDHEPARLLWIAHHLVIDAISWRILLEDLAVVCRQLQEGRTPQLPPKTTSFKAWSERLVGLTETVRAELDHWLAVDVRPLPRDASGPNTKDSVARVEIALPQDVTQWLLLEAPRAYDTQVNDVLLTALLMAFTEVTGEPSLVVDLESHGREEERAGADLSRTVGWFTTMFPVALRRESADPGLALAAVKAQLRAVPGRGFGYGLLRFGLPANERHAWPEPEVSFNYLGQIDSLSLAPPLRGFAGEDVGSSDASEGMRTHLIQVNGMAQGQRLRFVWTYSRNVHRPETMERLARAFAAAATRIVEHGRAREASYPLTPLQAGLLFHSLAERSKGEQVYATQLVFTLEGPLAGGAFREAWQRTVDRHPVLRSRFVWEGRNEPRQVVLRSAPLPWEELDWRDQPAPERERLLAARIEADKERGIALDRAPLLRFTLIRTADDVHHLLWTSHHILLDGWSGPILWQDVFAFYASLVGHENREPASLPPLPPPPPYDAYVRWLEQRDETASESFWRETLRGFTAPTPLTFASKEPTGLEGHRILRVRLDAASTSALKTLAEETRVTLNTVFQAAWALMLGRTSGLSDVVFGATVSGREADVPDIERMVGLFIRTVPVRVTIDEDGSLRALLKRIQAQQLEQRDFQYAALVDIHRWAGLRDGLSAFESMFVFENYPLDEATFEPCGLRLTCTGMASPTHFPLVVSVVPGKEIELLFDYDAARFDETTIAGLSHQCQELLSAMAACPDGKMAELSVLTENERRQILLEWSSDGRSDPAEETFLDVFREHVEKTPAATALVGPSVLRDDGWIGTLSYRELDGRVLELAHHLRRRGVGPEVAVGVCLERSIELVIAMLAIFDAGGVYVPLDATQPAERLAWIRRDARVEIVLTPSSLREALPRIEAEPDVPLPRIAKDDHLAYVLYTSGSTGHPKGILATRRNLSLLTPALVRAFDVRRASQVLQWCSLNFDGSISEVAMALGAGATLHLAPQADLSPGPGLQRLLETRGITHVTLLPAALRGLSPEGLPRLETLIVTGEVCPPALIRKWAVGRRFINAYGPTEITVAATTMDCHAEDGDRSPPIGRPIGSTEVYILDARMRPVPVRVPGDLYIGGAKVTRGYTNQPALTAAKFVPHPFSAKPGARLYATGDTAFWRPDGTIAFVGRRDDQVKVRGYRIELGEIEAALHAHPEVREAVVVVRNDPAGDNRLVAYFTSKTPAIVTKVEHLRDHLATRLVAYMVPSLFVALPEMPLNATGKIDRHRLPEPDASALDRATFVAPRTPAERTLARIWAETLRVEAIGVHDDFFKLGGHSLLAMVIMDRIRELFGRVLGVATLLQRPTVARLAQALDEDGDPASSSRLVPLRTEGTSPPLFFAAGLGLHVFYLHALCEHLGPDRPFYALNPMGAVDGDAPFADMDALACALADDVQAVQPRGPYHVGGHSAGARVAFAIALELERRGEDVPLVAIVDMGGPDAAAPEPAARAMGGNAARGLVDYVALVQQALGGWLPLSPERLRSMPEPDAWRAALEAFASAGLLPKNAGIGTLERMCTMNLEVVRVIQGHVPSTRYRGHLLALSALEAMPDGRRLTAEGWQAHCTRPITRRSVPGDHMTMLREPHVKELAGALRDFVPRASAPRGEPRELVIPPVTAFEQAWSEES